MQQNCGMKVSVKSQKGWLRSHMYKKYEKLSSCILFALMLASLLPLMYLGRYNHPTGDDYYYGAATKGVWLETGSIAETMKEAARGTADSYVNWQGTYSAMFLMHLPPNLFGESAYRFVTAVIVLLYAGSVFYLLYPMLCTWMKGSRQLWCAVSSAFVLLTIQTVPFKGESLFWYNGAMYYTGYFAVTLFFFGMTGRYLISGKRYFLPALMVLAVFLAGGNYVSLLPCILLTGTLTAALAAKHSRKGIWMGVVLLLLLGGLLISAAAPGNQVREGNLWEMSAFKAAAKSLVQGVAYLDAWLGRWWLMTALILTPLLWHTYGRVSFRFRNPVLVLGYLYGIFCSMSCPTFYAMNTTGPARVLAIVYYGFMGFTLIGYYYLLGFLYRWWEQRKVLFVPGVQDARKTQDTDTQDMDAQDTDAQDIDAQDAGKGKRRKFIGNMGQCVPQILAAGVFLLLLLMQLYSGELGECTSAKALYLLGSGEAAAYEQEYQERLAILRDDTVRDVVFQPYRHQPDMLYVGDFQGGTDNINNQKVAEYFNKDSLMVQY